MPKTESPLAVVIKLISAESFANFDKAKEYIDLESVYSNHPDTLSAEQAWKNQVTFFYNLAKDNKFTNNFKYYNYNIIERQEGQTAVVIFESMDRGDRIREISYTLIRSNKAWIIVKIDYIKK